MTLLLVFEAIDSNKLSMDETVTASAHAASMVALTYGLKKAKQ